MRHTVRHSQVWLCRYRIQSTTRHNCLIFPSPEVVLVEQTEQTCWKREGFVFLFWLKVTRFLLIKRLKNMDNYYESWSYTKPNISMKRRRGYLSWTW